MRRERAVLALAASLAAGAHVDAAAQTAATRELVARAVAYEHGEGVAKDPKLAATLYCEAARSGDPDAQFGLGWMYANGRGMPRDDRFAAGFFALAAAQRTSTRDAHASTSSAGRPAPPTAARDHARAHRTGTRTRSPICRRRSSGTPSSSGIWRRATACGRASRSR